MLEQSGDPIVSAPEDSPKEIIPPTEKPTLPTKEVHKRSKKEDRQHKKEDRAVEHFLKTLDGVPSEERFALLSKKFLEVADESRRLQAFIKQSDKRFAGVLKEKEQLQLEYNRTVLVKSKLENLCRELQKQNKTIKEESLLRIREEEERRKETQAKFQSALSEITSLLQQNSDKNNKLRDDNVSMSAKFRGVLEKSELREQQVEKMARQMSLEQQLSEAKLAKAGLEAQADRERHSAEIAQLKLDLGQCHARIVESQGTEASLRGQLAIYTDKYDEFQNALVKSNQVFGGFKGEMEKMSKKIVKLEKECISWKQRWESSQVAMLEMAEDKRLRDERSATTERQLAQLQRLCRSQQAERTVLVNTLKENNIERPPLPVLPPPPPAPPAQPSAPSKVDAMAANCAQLKQSLAHLQNQLSVLTTKKEENQVKPEPPLSGKTKKGKGKKSKADKEKTATLETDKSVSLDVTEGSPAPEDPKPLESTANNEVPDVASKVVDITNDESNKGSIADKSVSLDVSEGSPAPEDPKPLESTANNEVPDVASKVVDITNDESNKGSIGLKIDTESAETLSTVVANGSHSEDAEANDKTVAGVENSETNGICQISDNGASTEASESELCPNKESALSQQKVDETCLKANEVEAVPPLEEAQQLNFES